MIRAIFRFLCDVFKKFFGALFNAVKEVVTNVEAVVILVTASIGFTTLLVQLPFAVALPMWIEATMVIPVISVLVVAMLVIIMQWRLGNECSI